VIAVLVAGVGAQLLALAGAFPGDRATQNRIVITGPGRTGTGDQIQQSQAYVPGAVVSPGVYAMPHGSRAHELVAAAGGATADADLARVGPAGERAAAGTVYIPRGGEHIPPPLGGKLNSDTACERDFRPALGVSAEIAQRIVADRGAPGPFTAISQLLLVPLSQTSCDRIRLLVTV
jgi:competence protein ComEA